MFRTLLCILILFGAFYALSAQSAFSFLGPSDFASQRDVYGEGMGGTGSGDLFRINTGYVNPATSVSNTRAYFSTAISMGNVTYGDDTVTAKDDQFYLPYFNAAVLYKQNRYGFQYQNIASANINTVTLDADGTKNSIQRQFSLYKAGLFWANRNKYLHFGVGINYLFGHENTYIYQKPGVATMHYSQYEVEKSFRNPMFTLGIAKNHENISWGLSTSYSLDLEGETIFLNNTTKDTLDVKTVYQYPPTVNMGVTYKLSDMFYVSADGDYELWSRTENFDNPVDSIRLGIGGSWAGLPLSKVFFWKFPVRAGISYRNLPFKVENNYVNEMGYHFGFSIPLKSYDSYLDIATKYYTRGDVNTTIYKDTGFLLSIGIRGFDFFRTPPNRKTPREIPKTTEERENERRRNRGNRQNRE